VGRVVYRDQFEWDINNSNNSPEQFAECLCADMGLGPEFQLPIVLQIREKILDLQKQAYSERRQKGNNLPHNTSEL
jgi:SWI/SNF-related matrix-associated actin-dependent regulator of chromatin subfamily B protein 1